MKRIRSLIEEASSLIESLDCKDQNQKIVESGYDLIQKVLEREKKGKNISESIKVIGEDKWKRLKEIWKELNGNT